MGALKRSAGPCTRPTESPSAGASTSAAVSAEPSESTQMPDAITVWHSTTLLESTAEPSVTKSTAESSVTASDERLVTTQSVPVNFTFTETADTSPTVSSGVGPTSAGHPSDMSSTGDGSAADATGGTKSKSKSGKSSISGGVIAAIVIVGFLAVPIIAVYFGKKSSSGPTEPDVAGYANPQYEEGTSAVSGYMDVGPSPTKKSQTEV